MIELKIEYLYHYYCRQCHERWAMSKWPHIEPDQIKTAKCPKCGEEQTVIDLTDE